MRRTLTDGTVRLPRLTPPEMISMVTFSGQGRTLGCFGFRKLISSVLAVFRQYTRSLSCILWTANSPILRTTVDPREGSEWFNELREDGTLIDEKPMVEEWKCPYHNGRMCLRLMEAALPDGI